MLLSKATAAAAVGKMELARTHGTEIPEGWALDKWDCYYHYYYYYYHHYFMIRRSFQFCISELKES